MGRRSSRCLRSLFATNQINNNNNTTNHYKPKWFTTLIKSCKDVNRSSVVVSASSVKAPVDPASRAAVIIQSVFRGYLIGVNWLLVALLLVSQARKALRALRALVRLQALVRGYIVRKRAVDQVRRMHALIRAQERARAIRAPAPASSYSSSRTSLSCILDPSTPEDSEYVAQVRKRLPDQIKRGSAGAYSRRFDNGNINKIAEVDSSAMKSTKNKNLSVLPDYCSHKTNHTTQIPYPSEDFYSQYSNEIDRYSFYTADEIPLSHTSSFRSSTSTVRRGVSTTPADVNYTDQDHPNYMAYTKSSIAKMRSLSTPKQRIQLDRSSSQKCHSSHHYVSSRLSTSASAR